MKCQQQIANHICWFGAKIHVTQPVNAANYCWVATPSEYKWCYEVYVVLAVKYEYVDMHVVWYSGSDWSTFTLHRLSELCCDGRLHSAHQITVDLESSGAHIPLRLALFKLTVHRTVDDRSLQADCRQTSTELALFKLTVDRTVDDHSLHVRRHLTNVIHPIYHFLVFFVVGAWNLTDCEREKPSTVACLCEWKSPSEKWSCAKL